MVYQEDPDIIEVMCKCEEGYWEDTVKEECVLCHLNCDVCHDPSKKCERCAPGKYRYLNEYCEDFCPHPYIGDDTLGICVYDPEYYYTDPYNVGCA